MRSLFLKVFLWFWLAMALVIAALVFATYATRTQREPRPPQFIEGVMTAYALNAVESYERGGASSLDSFLKHIESEAQVRAHLFDANGKELAGEDATPDERELAARVARDGGTASRMLDGSMLEARTEQGRDGNSYAFVAALHLRPPHDGAMGQTRPPRPFLPPTPFNFLLGDTPASLAARLAAVILTAGILCYLLARYLVAPVVRLRAVTRQLSRGDLSARVGPALGKRRDEIGAMGRDFDEMATRIETLVSAQNRLVRDISHELRSPLARLNVALDLARKRAGSDATSALMRIEREAVRLNEMIGQLLSLARRESDGDQLPRERVDLAQLVRAIAEDADFEARSQNRSVVVARCDDCATTGTHALLRSAVENVVRNATRHTPEGTAVEVSLECSSERDGYAKITVRDCGAGVPEAMLTDIFRPFYRVDDARDRESGGTGLGLAITERAVRTHGGTITAANVAGGGFVVEIRLPVAAPHS
jgi:two-component system sensor histidine kinase CpxA